MLMTGIGALNYAPFGLNFHVIHTPLVMLDDIPDGGITIVRVDQAVAEKSR